MRALGLTGLGLLLGLLVSLSSSAGCGCTDHRGMPPGSYRSHSPGAEPDYVFAIDEGGRVTEQFTRGGKRFVLVYQGRER